MSICFDLVNNCFFVIGNGKKKKKKRKYYSDGKNEKSEKYNISK